MSARKPPLIRCQCGRLHRSWNPFKICKGCVRDRKSDGDAAVAAQVRQLERLLVEPPAELVAARERIHARWLARQPADHPWRVDGREGGRIVGSPT